MVFNEGKRGLDKEPSCLPEERQYVQIECLSDDEPVDIVTEVPSSATSAESEESIVRRSARERRPPDFYSTHVNVASEASNEPASMKEAIESPDKEKWTDAIQKEMDSLYENEVWDLVKLPKDRYAVSNVAKYSAKPTKQHWMAVKRIFRYLKGTIDYGLFYSKDGSDECVGYSDSDWAGDLNDRKSTSGYLFQISGAAISWRSKKQTCVALSTAEAEYIALASASQEAMWLRQLTTDLKSKPTGATVIFEDNQSAICIAKNPQFHGRSKHIAIKYHFIREQVHNNTVTLKYCSTNNMIADMLTKGLSGEQFAKLRHMAGIRSMIEQSASK